MTSDIYIRRTPRTPQCAFTAHWGWGSFSYHTHREYRITVDIRGIRIRASKYLHIWIGEYDMIGQIRTGVDVYTLRNILPDDCAGASAVAKAHGCHRTRQDARRAIIAALTHPRWGKKSDTEIGEHVGVDHHTVAARRKELETTREIPKSDRDIAEQIGVAPTTIGKYRHELEPTIQTGQSQERIGRDGRTMNITKIGHGRKPATDTTIIDGDSEIARRAGVSQNFVSEIHRSLKSKLSEHLVRSLRPGRSDDTPRQYTTKHGTPATMNVTNIGHGRKPATDTTVSRHRHDMEASYAMPKIDTRTITPLLVMFEHLSCGKPQDARAVSRTVTPLLVMFEHLSCNRCKIPPVPFPAPARPTRRTPPRSATAASPPWC